MKLLLAITVAFLAACATPPAPKKSLACQTTPQWFTNDAHGTPAAAVYVCFGDDGALLWQSRALKPEEVAKVIAAREPAPTVAPVTTPEVPPVPIALKPKGKAKK